MPVLSQFHAVPLGYRADNLWKNQDAYLLVIPLPLVYQLSRRWLVPSGAYLGELFADAAKPGGELKPWDVTTGREVSTLRREIRPSGAFACSSDGRRLALTELFDVSGPVAVWVWDSATGRERSTAARARSPVATTLTSWSSATTTGARRCLAIA